MNKTTNIFTVDVEEYYHAENILNSLPSETIDKLESRVEIGTRKILGLLEKYDSKATFFVLGCVAEKNPGLIKDIAGAGHEIASHGYKHIPLHKHTRETFDEDLGKSVKILSDITGEKVFGYRATSFSLTENIEWFCDVLIKHGVAYDSSISCSLSRKYWNIRPEASGYFTISRGIKELPVSFYRLGPIKIPLGGGYFRAFPHWVTRWGMQQVHSSGVEASIFYIHPWELDPGQPRFSMSFSNRFRHYSGLAGTEGKLDKLLKERNFISIKHCMRFSSG